MERPRTRALVLDDEAGSGGETAAKFTEKLSVSVSVRTHRHSPPAPHPASHAGHTPSCARMRGLTTIKSPRGAAQPALALDAAGAGAGAMQAGHHLRPQCAVWPGCIGPATPPPASGVDLGGRSRPSARRSTGLAPRWRPLAPLFLLSDSSLWYQSVSVPLGTSQRPSLSLLGLRPYGGSVWGWGGCQRVFSALPRVPQSMCFGGLVTLWPFVSMSLAIVFSDVLALVPLSGHPVTS